MSQRGSYSPRRYGRSEHAPIVIDMVDYGNDDYADDFTYSSSHYTSPRHTAGSVHSTGGTPRHSHSNHGIASHHSVGGSPRHTASPRHSSPRHTSSRHSSPRHHHHSHGSRHSSNSSTHTHASKLTHTSAIASPRQAVHMHNFAQRRSFMMGGFDDEKPDDYPPEEVESSQIYRMEEQDDDDDDEPLDDYGDYPKDRLSRGGGVEAINENEYRQSPGRSRSFRLVDEVDTRDRRVPVVDTLSHHSQNLHHHSQHQLRSPSSQEMMTNKPYDEYSDDLPIYSTVGSSGRYDMEVTSPGHHNMHMEDGDRHGATFPVFDRMKRPEESVFTFDTAVDNDLHTVPGIINRPTDESNNKESKRETLSVAPSSTTEKKVFYFDIDDLSQRLLNSGDQDLSRRLRKKKAKNARSRISRNRARRKSKKSVFNLELDSTATSLLRGNDNSVVTSPDDMSKTYASRFDNQSIGGGSALYIDTSAEVDNFGRASISPPRTISAASPREENAGVHLRRNPSVGSPPAEHKPGILSPTGTMDQDAESVQDRSKAPNSPREEQIRSPRSEVTSPHSTSPHYRSQDPPEDKKETGSVAEPEKVTAASPTQGKSTVASPRSPENGETGLSNRKVKGPGSSEIRVTKVYDDISDRLDHIVRRENDVENRQKAIRAVFEEVQQHVADLRRHKHHGSKIGNGDKNERIVDLLSLSDKPKRAIVDEGDDQVIKRMNDSSDNEDSIVKHGQIRRQPPVTYRPVENSQLGSSATIMSYQSMASRSTPPVMSLRENLFNIVDRPKVSQSPKSINVEPRIMSTIMKESSNQDLYKKQDSSQLGTVTSDDGGKNRDARPSSYLSSDNSGDDDLVVQNQSTDNDVVYVVEEEDGKSVVHVDTVKDSQAQGRRNTPNSAEIDADKSASPKNREGKADANRNSPMHRHGKADAKVSRDEPEKTEHTKPPEAKPKSQPDNKAETTRPQTQDDVEHPEIDDRADTDGDKLVEPDATKQKGKKDESKKETTEEPRSPVSMSRSPVSTSRSPVSTSRSPVSTSRSPVNINRSLTGGVLDSDNDDNVDIDKEFELVIPLDTNDTQEVSYNIDETLNRVARQSELEKKEKEQKPKPVVADKSQGKVEKTSEPNPTATPAAPSMSRKDEEEKANALLDSLSTGGLFVDQEALPSPSQLSYASRGGDSKQSKRQFEESGSNLNDSFIDLDDEDDNVEAIIEGKKTIKKSTIEEEENDGVSLDYDFNLAISAASKTSSSASDLKEFPMTPQQQEEDDDDEDDDKEDEDDDDDDDDEEDDEEDYADNYGSASSSNVSSDISESSSGSATESSYDSFISIVETEDESDLEFFDEQEGFAENFMSNLVSSTFGWIEKKQEQLVCGFKSGEFDGPSLLRQSMGRQKKSDAEAAKERNKTMKGLRNAVSSKYGRENSSLPISASAASEGVGEKKHKSSSKKNSRNSEEITDGAEERKRSKRENSISQGSKQKAPSSKSAERAKKKEAENSSGKPEKVKQHVADSRKKSLVDERKEFESDTSSGDKEKAETDDKRKANQKKASSQEQDEGKTPRAAQTSQVTSNNEMKANSKPSSRSKSKTSADENVGPYNFDFLNTDDDEADGTSSVEVIAVRPASISDAKRVQKEMKKASKKKADPKDDGRKKLQAPRQDAEPTITIKGHVSPSKSKSGLFTKEHKEKPDLNNAESEPTKSKSKRTGKQAKSKAKPPSPPRLQGHASRAGTKTPDTQDAISPSPRKRSPSPDSRAKAPPSKSNAVQQEPSVNTVAAEKISRRVSSKNLEPKAAKASKKTSKKERTAKRDPSSKVSVAESKRSSRSGRRRVSESRGRAPRSPIDEKRDESESDAESMNNMTEEEREKARKERRRAAALKRRRKLRERRRTKLELNNTDDTF